MVGVGRGEQRKHQRVPFDGEVRVDGVPGDGVDVSVGGLRVKSVHPAPALESVVVVEFNLPGAGPVATQAEVVRIEEGVYVLRFARLAPATMMTLVRYCAVEAA